LRRHALAGLALLIGPSAGWSQTSGIVCSFEPAESYAPGAFTSAGRWTVAGTCRIMTGSVGAGTQLLQLEASLPVASVRAELAELNGTPRTFVDFSILPVSAVDPAGGTLIWTEIAKVGFARTGSVAVLSYFDPGAGAAGEWKRTTGSVTVAEDSRATSWMRVTIRQDYEARRWDLYANGVLVAAGIAAPAPAGTESRALTVAGTAAAETRFDDLYAGSENPLFVDADRDGMEDTWEKAHGLNPERDDAYADADADGVSNIQEYLRGTDPATGVHTLSITSAETAGIAGFRPLWDTPIVLAEDGAVEENVLAEPGRADYGVAPSARWFPEHPLRQNGVRPGGLVFDAVHRSLLVRFPTAAATITAELNKGFRIRKVAVILPFRATELWPEYYRGPAGLSFLGGLWKDHPPRWHAIAWLLRRPWSADPLHGPTFNANIAGVSHWTKYGAQDVAQDRFGGSFSAEVSSSQPNGELDLTAAIAADSSALGGTLPDRLAVLNNQGLLIRKLESYDFFYFQGGYEWGMGTGGRGILVHTPTLQVEFEPDPAPATHAAATALNLSREIERVQQSGSGGAATAVLPTEAEFADLSARFGFHQPGWMPAWQWERVQSLRALPSLGFAEETPSEFPQTRAGYGDWLDQMLSIPPYRWAGFEAPKQVSLYLRNAPALPAPVRDHWKLYWWSWLLPDRPWQNADGTLNFIQPFTNREAGWQYYQATHDWRGNASLYRTYSHDMGPQDFNYFSIAAVLLGGAVLESPAMITEGRRGAEEWLLRHWTWRDGSTQESIDHYYFAISLSAQKAFADYGPTPYDRLLGKLMLTKCVDELATHYHPALRRFISLSGRTGTGYVLGNQDGLQHIIHTMSRSGALTDFGQTSVAGITVLGHDFLPSAVAGLSMDGPWAPEWFSNVVDEKSLPFQSKVIGDGVLKTSYLGANYGLASGIGAQGTIPFLAQWRRASQQPSSLREIGTLLLRYGINRTEFLDTQNAGVVGNQGALINTLQHRNKALVLASPTSDLNVSNGRALPATVSSLQTTIGFYNFELSPTWELYVDGGRITSFPCTIQNTQRITIRDGVSFIGILPLPATDLGRTGQVVLSTEAVETALQGGGTAREALRIDNYNFRASTAVDRSSLDPAKLDRAWGGYAVEMGDVSEYGSFAAFQAHVAAIQMSTTVSGGTVDVVYTSGADTLTARYSTDGAGSLLSAQANGQNVGLPGGIVRDTDVSIQGTSGALMKHGVTLTTDPLVMAYLHVEPVSGTYLGAIGTTDSSRFVLQAPGGVMLRSEAKVAMFRASVRPAENRLWIDCGAPNGGAVPGRALVVSGLSGRPTVELNGAALGGDQILTLPGATGASYVIPLNGELDDAIRHDYADTDGNGLPDAWEQQWFHQAGIDASGDADRDGVSNATEFLLGTNPRLSDAWIQAHLGALPDDPFADPGNVGRSLLQSFEAGTSPWPTPLVPQPRAWYRADLGVASNPAYYNQLVQWTDLSGNGFHLGPTPGVTAPFWQPGGADAAPSVYCQGWWSQLATAAPVDLRAGTGDLTIIAVVNPGASQGDRANLLDFGAQGGYWVSGFQGNRNNQYTFGWHNAAGGFSGTPAVTLDSGRIQVLSGVAAAGIASVRVNGRLMNRTVLPNDANLTPARLVLGNGSYPYYGWDGRVAEILIYNRALGDAERERIEQALLGRYVPADGDQDGLPDAWEDQYLGTLSYGGSDDPGAVGRSLLESWRQNVSPWPAPTVNSGLMAWFRADCGVGRNPNGAVTRWADASGHGLHLESSTALPAWQAAALNGRPAVRFSGQPLSTRQSVDPLAGSGDATVVAVFVPDDAQPAYHRVLEVSNGGQQSLYLGTGAGRTQPYVGLTWATAGGTTMQSSGEVPLRADRLTTFTAVKAGGTAADYVNGTCLNVAAVSEGMFSGGGRLSVGGFNGRLVELYVYNRALTEQERVQLEQEVTARYAAADADADGLPDVWEDRFFGTLSFGPGDDPGAVGRSLAQSYRTGQSPWPAGGSGLRLWYRADLGVQCDSSKRVRQWADASGNGVHLFAPTTQVLWAERELNGRAAVQFAGSPLITPEPVRVFDGSDLTVIAVVREKPAERAYARVFESGSSTFYLGSGYEDGTRLGLFWSKPSGTGIDATGDVPIPAGPVHVFVGTKRGATAMAFLDGVSVARNGVEPGLPAITAPWRLGGFDGALAELRVYSRALSDDEREQIERELAVRYSLTGMLERRPAFPGNFVDTGNFHDGLHFAAASAALPDGRVLFAGGQHRPDPHFPYAFYVQKSAEVFDPKTGTFAMTGSLSRPRFGGAAVTLPSGKIAVLGGFEAASIETLCEVEVWDPATGTFSVVGQTPMPACFVSATLLADGRVLVAGGKRQVGISMGQVWAFDPTSGSAVSTPVLPRSGSAVVRLQDGRVLIAGGRRDYGGSGTTALEIFDPATNQVTYVADMNEPRAAAKAILLSDGRVMICGGGIHEVWTQLWPQMAEIFDPVLNKVTKTFPMPYDNWLVETADRRVYFGTAGKLLNVQTGAVETIAAEGGAVNEWFSLSDGRYLLAESSSTELPWLSRNFRIFVPNGWNEPPIIPTGLRAWYRADAGVVRDADGKVSQWQDLSGRGVHLEQEQPAARPSCAAAGATGAAAVRFDGNSWVQTTAVKDMTGGSTDFTVLLTVTPAEGTSGERVILDQGLWATGGVAVRQGDGMSGIAAVWRSSAGAWGTTSPVAVLAGRPQMVVVTKRGAILETYRNGVLQLRQPCEVDAGPGAAMVAVGAAVGGGNRFVGSVSEVLVYSRALTDAERQQIEGAWTSKYSLADTDRDGLPDAWELQYFGSLEYGPTADPMGVGRTLQDSYAQKLSPLPAAPIEAGLRAWYRADAGLVRDADGKVRQWNDLSGQGVHLEQEQPAARPSHAAAGATGAAAVRFDGNSWVQTTAVKDMAGGSADFTVLMTVAPAEGTSGERVILDQGLWTTGGVAMRQGDGMSGIAAVWRSSAGAWGVTSPVAVLAGRPQMVSVTKRGATLETYRNGVLQLRQPCEVDAGPGAAMVAVGAAVGGGNRFQGAISEVLVYSRALTDAERQQIEGACTSKYSLADTDRDGLPDAWELQYFGSLEYGPTADPMGVGRTLQDSYAQKLSPLPAAPIEAGLRAWYRADAGLVRDADGKVRQWNDLSGQGVHLEQEQPAARPSHAAAGATGAAAVRFDGNSWVQTTAVKDMAGGSADFTVLMTVAPAEGTSGERVILDQGLWTTGGVAMRQGDGMSGIAAVWRSSAGAWGVTSPVAVLAGRPQMVSVTKRGATLETYRNGVLQLRQACEVDAGPGAAMVAVGAAVGGGNRFVGAVSEALVYSRALTDAERQQIEGAWTSKYSLADSDRDGLPDAWELQYFGSLEYDATADPMGVGRTLQDSYAQKLSPLPAAPIEAGLRAWYRADAGVVRDADGKVSQWNDLSGQGVHLEQEQPAARPSYAAAGATGAAAVRFDGNSWVQTTAVKDMTGGSTDFTVLLTVAPAEGTSGERVILDQGLWATGGVAMRQGDGMSGIAAVWRSSAGAWGVTSPVTVLSGRPQIVAVTKRGTTVETYRNGVLQLRQPCDVDAGAGAAMVAVGAAVGGGNRFVGAVSEALVYSRALTDAERQQLEGELAQRSVLCLRALEPASIAGGAEDFDLTVRGVGFVAGSVVQWNGSERATTYVDAQTLVARIPAADVSVTVAPCTAQVTVRAPEGLVTAALPLEVRGAGPKITRPPSSLTVAAGATATFAVEATGSGELSYQWLRDGVPIVNETGRSLVLADVRFAAQATYAVVVTNMFGTVRSEDAALVVNVPPSIERGPSDVLVAQGASVTLQVVASGSSPMSYRWQKDGSDIPGATGVSLLIENASSSVVGNYRVIVQNPFGTATSAEARVALEFALSSVSPTRVRSDGGSFLLAARGTGFLAGDTIHWNNQPRATTFVSSGELQATISAEDAARGGNEIGTVLVCVVRAPGVITGSLPVQIVSAAVTEVQTAVAAPATQAVASLLPAAPAAPGVAVVLENRDANSAPAAVSVATYDRNITPAACFDVGGGFVDVQTTGTDATDRLAASFYYPATLTGAAESQVTLLYFDGGAWSTVLSSGGVAPLKLTDDSLDGTVSGGRFTVVFDDTSTPKLSDLTGTVFTTTVLDRVPPVIHRLQASPAVLNPPNHKMVPVTIAVDATDNVDPRPVSRIVGVRSNQSVDANGDGHTSDDWQITGALTLNVRSERAGGRGDRIYTITVETRDAAGNRSLGTTTVTVAEKGGRG
jgi:hypothetical protein